MFDFRDYQQKFYDGIHAGWEEHRAVLGTMATGGGKTVVIAKTVESHDGAALVAAHRREIMGQLSVSLGRQGIKHRIIAPRDTVRRIRKRHLRKIGKSFIDQHAWTGVASAQTLASKGILKEYDTQRWLKQVTKGIYDEGHHYIKGASWGRAVEAIPNAKLLFMTATPERCDGKGLGSHADGFCDVMVEGPQTYQLLNSNPRHLTPFKYFTPETDLDIDDIPLTASGDLNMTVMRKRVIDSDFVGDIVEHYREFAEGVKTLVFASDVDTAEDMARAFRRAGYKAVALSSRTDPNVREAEMENFEDGDLDIIVNVDLFDEGVDVAGVGCVMLGRPTDSLSKYLQMVGRALRLCEGKEFAIIIDAVRNWERHHLPHVPRRWTLDGTTRDERQSSDLLPDRVCVECSQPYNRALSFCPYPGCGEEYVPAERGTIGQTDGSLSALDLEAYDEIYARMAAANVPLEDYGQDQIARNIPPIGRAADLKRHKVVLHRRKVLNELIAWWAGLQKGRSKDEINRRFYLRFGVDTVTAFTLDTNGTNNLIDAVRQKFDIDIKSHYTGEQPWN